MADAPLYANVNGIRVAYDRTGDGFGLLLLHGFPRTRRTWAQVTPALAERFTVVAPDRRGYGDSDRPSDPAAYDNAHMAQDALELTQHLGWKEFLVVGHDKGAPVARRLAADHPESVRGAMIIDGIAEGANVDRRRDPTGRTWYFDFFRQRGVAEQIIGQDPGLFFGLFLDRNPHLSPEQRAFYVEQFSKPGTTEAVLADYRAALEGDREKWAEETASGARIRTPMYFIWGADGPVGGAPVLDAWRQVADDIRGGEAVPGAAHYVHEQQPEATVRHIMRFADELGLP
ncbi:MAG: alpha/beta hydrolase [Chloroflexi bacterium]|nr:alpha/beta hydrolase [Chloroflexota bacterium]